MSAQILGAWGWFANTESDAWTFTSDAIDWGKTCLQRVLASEN
jgi:hypothetical protein